MKWLKKCCEKEESELECQQEKEAEMKENIMEDKEQHNSQIRAQELLKHIICLLKNLDVHTKSLQLDTEKDDVLAYVYEEPSPKPQIK